MPTRLLPGPMSASSASRTVCRIPPGSSGSTVRANSVFRVLAGGSLRWASLAASTSPLPASATTQDSADTSGTSGAPRCGRTCVPERYSWDGPGITAWGPGGAGSPVCCPAETAAGASASTPVTHREQADKAAR